MEVPAPGGTPAPGEPEKSGAGKRKRKPKRKRRGPGPFTLLALPGLTVLVGSVVFLTVAGKLPGTEGDEPARPPAAAGDADATALVDDSFVPWLKQAAGACTVLRPSVLAAQIDAYSGWNADSAALSGPAGIAGFDAAGWKKWGKDADGDGTSSPRQPVDAIMALGRQDCALADEVTKARTSGTVNGDLLDLTLAAYTTDTAQVTAAGKVPAKAAAYVKRTEKLAKRYARFDKGGASPGQAAAPTSALLAWPSATHSVSSPFGTREHPLTHVTKLHTGVDFPAAQGTPVTAAREGTVVFAAPTKAYGNRIVVDHGTIGGAHVQTTYSHLSVLRATRGQRVSTGTVLGDVGSTGLSTGPHLHFEVIRDGYYDNPMPWLGATG
ncbi:M23 family metallopeptidase [Streptomyces sp. SPB074]|uniref:M23 family metallopeptidase n=1 Tax=Streptomyces sp. (strain SPB074) TaxID=465543 RepID=UPI00017F27FF|nr:M23 family metallopeptidase [Streptomyces sp. SPB074]EDY46358.1 M23 peptidase domain-containing protein [Streptomyces sp. SPB074]